MVTLGVSLSPCIEIFGHRTAVLKIARDLTLIFSNITWQHGQWSRPSRGWNSNKQLEHTTAVLQHVLCQFDVRSFSRIFHDNGCSVQLIGMFHFGWMDFPSSFAHFTHAFRVDILDDATIDPSTPLRSTDACRRNLISLHENCIFSLQKPLCRLASYSKHSWV